MFRSLSKLLLFYFEKLHSNYDSYNYFYKKVHVRRILVGMGEHVLKVKQQFMMRTWQYVQTVITALRGHIVTVS